MATILSNKEQQIEAIKQIVAREAEMGAQADGKLSGSIVATSTRRGYACEWLSLTT